MLLYFLPMSKRTFSENICRSHMTAKLVLMAPFTMQCHHMEILQQVFLLLPLKSSHTQVQFTRIWDGQKDLEVTRISMAATGKRRGRLWNPCMLH